MSWSSGLTGQTGQPGQTGQTGQTDLTIKLDFSGNLCRAAFAVLAMFRFIFVSYSLFVFFVFQHLLPPHGSHH